MEDGEIGTSRKHRFAQAGIAPQRRAIIAIQNGFRGLVAYDKSDDSFSRSKDIGNAVAVCAICHHGIGINVDLEDRVDQGIDVLIDYFTGDWLNSFEETEGCRLRENNYHALPEAWMKVFIYGLVLCSISSRQDALLLCSKAISHIRITSSMRPCYGFTVADVASLLLIANEFYHRKRNTLKECNDAISKSRLLRPKKIATALQAITDFDEDLFRDSLHWLLDEYLFERPWKSNAPQDWIARIESFLYQHAQYRGMAPPELTERESQYIITKHTALRNVKPM